MTNEQNSPRILVIDDEDRVREDLRAIFEPLGYDVQVAMGSGPALLDDAKNRAGTFRPHVAIVDMRLLLNDDPNDRSGIELVEALDPAHCILYSSYISLEISRELAKFKAAGWIGKQEPPSKLVELVNNVAKVSSTAQNNFRIDKNSIDFDKESRALLGKDVGTSPFLIQDILSQVFPGAYGVKVETIPGAVKTPMSVNRGRSLILKAKRKGMSEPFVVKLAKRADILREYRNYKDYIEGNLKGGFYAHLIDEPATFWDIGAVKYTFIGSSDDNIVFSLYYQREEDSNKILKPLQTFFGEVWYGLYSGETKEIETSLYSSYDKFLKLEERLTGFSDKTEYRAFRGINVDMPNPVTWVLRHGADSSTLSARQAITHGDLHGDNLFVDGVHAWAIDFERSGEGHILRDFTELEVDILTRLAWKKNEKDLREFFYLLTCLADPHYFKETPDPIGLSNKEFRKAFNVVKGLRSLAKDIAKFKDVREYTWSLLLDLVFVATYNGGEALQRERSLLYASVLCSCLQHWGSEWPPEEWKPTLAGVQTSAEIIPSGVSVADDLPAKSDSMQEIPARITGKNEAQRLPSELTTIIGAGAFLVLETIMIVALWWAMNLFGITFLQALATFILLSLFAIIVFTLLGLVKGSDALKTIVKMFSILFNRGMRSPDKELPPPGETNNDKLEG